MYPVKIFLGGDVPPNVPHGPTMFVIDSKISDLIANKLIYPSRLSPIVRL